MEVIYSYFFPYPFYITYQSYQRHTLNGNDLNMDQICDISTVTAKWETYVHRGEFHEPITKLKRLKKTII